MLSFVFCVYSVEIVFLLRPTKMGHYCRNMTVHVGWQYRWEILFIQNELYLCPMFMNLRLLTIMYKFCTGIRVKTCDDNDDNVDVDVDDDVHDDDQMDVSFISILL